MWQGGPRFAQHLDSIEVLELGDSPPQFIENKESGEWSTQWRDGPAMTKARRWTDSGYRLGDADLGRAGIRQ